MTIYLMLGTLAVLAAVFLIYGLALRRGAIGLIHRKYWRFVKQGSQMAYCRAMGLATIILAVGFAAGGLTLAFTGALEDSSRVAAAFGVLLFFLAIGYVRMNQTQKKYNLRPNPGNKK